MHQHYDGDDTCRPHNHDVISGRGNYVNAHPGNQFFRKLVKAVRAEYVGSLKQDKRAVAKYIVNIIRTLDPPGKFLSRDSVHVDNSVYHDIGDQKAVDKTRQALREGAPDVEKGIKDGTIQVSKRKDLERFVSDMARKVYAQQFSGCYATIGQNFEPNPINQVMSPHLSYAAYQEEGTVEMLSATGDVCSSNSVQSNEDQYLSPNNLHHPAAGNYSRKERSAEISPSGMFRSSPYCDWHDGKHDVLLGLGIPDMTTCSGGQTKFPRDGVSLVSYPSMESRSTSLPERRTLPNNLRGIAKLPTDKSTFCTVRNNDEWQLLSTGNANWAENSKNRLVRFVDKACCEPESRDNETSESAFVKSFLKTSIDESGGCATIDSSSRFEPLSNSCMELQMLRQSDGWHVKRRRSSSLPNTSKDNHAFKGGRSSLEEDDCIGHFSSKNNKANATIMTNAPRKSFVTPSESILSNCRVSPGVLSITTSIDSSKHFNEPCSERTSMNTSLLARSTSRVSMILNQPFPEKFDGVGDEASMNEDCRHDPKPIVNIHGKHRMPSFVAPRLSDTIHRLDAPQQAANRADQFHESNLPFWSVDSIPVKELLMSSIGTFDQSEDGSVDATS